MNAVTVTASVLTLLAGVGVFLTACSTMSAELEALGGDKLKALFEKTSKSKLAGVGVGTAASALIQSSGATTVTAISLVNAGIITLSQAATIIFGANIGTTVTGQLAALGLLGDGELSASTILAAFAGIGAFVSAFSKNKTARSVGRVVTGFGMLFVGLTVMSGATNRFAELDEVKGFFATFENPFMLIVVGTIFTAIVQSSSVVTTMCVTSVVSGLITLEQGVYFTMGANVGTCVTAFIASAAGSTDAKRTALIHLLFNVGGVVLFAVIGIFVNFSDVLLRLFPNSPQIGLASFHTFLNIVTAVMILPFTEPFVKLVVKLTPEKNKKRANSRPSA